MHFFILHVFQFNKCSYHVFSNYGVKMKIYGEIIKKSNNLNRRVLGDTLQIKFQWILAFRTTTNTYSLTMESFYKFMKKYELTYAHKIQ